MYIDDSATIRVRNVGARGVADMSVDYRHQDSSRASSSVRDESIMTDDDYQTLEDTKCSPDPVAVSRWILVSDA